MDPRRGPSPGRYSSAPARPGSLFGVDLVPAELLAQRGDDLHREALVLAGGEPLVDRGGDSRDRDRIGDRVLHGPAPRSRIIDVAGDFAELVALRLERRGQ